MASKRNNIHPVESAVVQVISARRLIATGETVLVAVSGGLDSMVLLSLLARGAAKGGWKLCVAHFNHQLRGKASDADEVFVAKEAGRLKLPFKSGEADVAKHARSKGVSVEMAARELRHAFLVVAAKAFNTSKIAFAHHANDQVELFFLRLFRGTGSDGLAGMKWQSPAPGDPSLTLIRPLLGQTRKALEEYAVLHSIKFRKDDSNDSVDIPRNRIRHELIPLIQLNYQRGIEAIILREMEILEAESDLIQAMAFDWLKTGQGRESFQLLPLAIQRKVIGLQLHHLGMAVDFDLIETLRNRPGYPVQVSPKIILARDSFGEVTIQKEDIIEAPTGQWEVEIGGKKGVIHAGTVEIAWERVSNPEKGGAGTHIARKRQVNFESFDAESVGNRVTLRHWQPGDRFQPIGMEQPVKLQDFFSNHKVPKAERHQLLVGVAECGEIFWVQGMRIGEHFKLTKRSSNLLNWRWKNL